MCQQKQTTNLHLSKSNYTLQNLKQQQHQAQRFDCLSTLSPDTRLLSRHTATLEPLFHNTPGQLSTILSHLQDLVKAKALTEPYTGFQVPSSSSGTMGMGGRSSSGRSLEP